MLGKCSNDFVRNRSIGQLKRFVNKNLNLVGTWKSLGGDIKHFTNEATDIGLKWLGTSKKKLITVKKENYTVKYALSKLLNDKMAKKSAEKISINADEHLAPRQQKPLTSTKIAIVVILEI
jgi:hypothetical protein